MNPGPTPAAPAGPPTGPRPLDGVRILAAEQMQALPYATQLLGWMGADVIKVEHPVTGESGRASKPTAPDAEGRQVGATYLRNNLGKRSVGIDLKSRRGRDLFLRLARQVDVVAENFKPGTMDRLGLGYADVAAAVPQIIYVSVSGFGNTQPSPYRSWPAYAPIPEAMAGYYERNRRHGERPRSATAGALGDIGTSLYAGIGLLAALRHRDLTGQGQHVDVAMFDAMVAMADIVPFFWSMGVRQEPGTAPPPVGILDSFATADGHVVIHVVREAQFEAMARLTGNEGWLTDDRLATRQAWGERYDELVRPGLEAWAADKGKVEVAGLLADLGVAAGPSNLPGDVVSDPHVRDHNMLVAVPRPDGEPPLLVPGNPIKLSAVPDAPTSSMPTLGGDTDEVLTDLGGLSPDEIADLRADGTVS